MNCIILDRHNRFCTGAGNQLDVAISCRAVVARRGIGLYLHALSNSHMGKVVGGDKWLGTGRNNGRSGRSGGFQMLRVGLEHPSHFSLALTLLLCSLPGGLCLILWGILGSILCHNG